VHLNKHFSQEAEARILWEALFNITRAVALVCVTVFLLGIVAGALYGVSVWQETVDTKITPQEIVDPLKPVKAAQAEPSQPQGTQPPANNRPAESPLAGFKIPFSLQGYASGWYDSATNMLRPYIIAAGKSSN
jgi:hypothetical protein